ncbi:MAG: methyltransferase domain-containing protein [Gammaproteobacteria bacterium]|nr:methyltransferase domain-containing protein [Gammaproteobacteria bacterium]
MAETAEPAGVWGKDDVIRYWEELTDHYLQFGTTIQAGVFRTPDFDGWSLDASNRAFLGRAGLRSGEVVLDAGCGVGGPCLYAAAHIPDLEVHGITVSPYQAEVARRLIDGSTVGDRVQVHVGDYHELPFPDGMFDRVLFLESAGYSFELERLFSETARVLRPGGSVYIKDVFCRDGELGAVEAEEMEAFRRINVYRTPTMEEMVSALGASGLSDIWALDITPSVITMPREIEFGLPRFRKFPNLPAVWGEIIARCPRSGRLQQSRTG